MVLFSIVRWKNTIMETISIIHLERAESGSDGFSGIIIGDWGCVKSVGSLIVGANVRMRIEPILRFRRHGIVLHAVIFGWCIINGE